MLAVTLLTACDRNAPALSGPAPAASAVSVAPSAVAGVKQSIFKPFEFELVGEIPGAKDGDKFTLVLAAELDAAKVNEQDKPTPPRPLASGLVKDGRLRIQGRSDLPQPVFIYREGDEYAVGSFLLQEGTMTLSAPRDGHWHLANARYGQEVARRYSEAFHQAQAQVESLMQRQAALPPKSKAAADIDKQLESWINKSTALEMAEQAAFITDESADPFERLLALDSNVDEERFPIPKRMALLEMFEQKIGPHPVIDGRRAILQREMRELEAQKTVLSGAMFKEVVGVDIHGQEVKLSDMVKRNKVVLLDIWASWCGICREEFPHLKKTYAKYRSQGFEIFAISTDEKRKEWIEAMQEDQTTNAWPQLHDGRGPNANVAKDYGVTGYPSKFLITQDGKIVANGNTQTVDLDKLLPKLLK